jgi:serine beta-lactamase-like protein LACTB, mitochondrial
MRRIHVSAAVMLMSLVATAVAQPTTPTAPVVVPPATIDTLAQDTLHRQNIPAMTLAVIDHGRIAYSHAFGRSDVENDVAATPASEIRTASIAKPMTAMAAMELARAGKLDLDAPVQQYCPAFPAKTSPDGKPWVVTTRELLSHRAGVRWYRDDVETRNVRHYTTLSDAVRHFGYDPLLFAPDEKMQYSTYGFVVVGCAIEGASHSTFTDYMQQGVFTPSGMTATLPDDPAKIIPHRSRGYEKTKADALANAPFFDPSDRLPGGGWLSTSDDLANFAAAVMDGKLVPVSDLEEMWKPLTVQDDGTGYGLGWAITKLAGHRIVGHNGGQAGTSTCLKLVPDRQLAVAIMGNLEGAALDELANSILELYLVPAAGSQH